MEPSFGTRLRLQRERRQVPLTAIAEQTKIKVSLLEALERDDVRHWPSGIFRRSYIRAYAQAIGLDPDAVVREFLELHPDPVEDIPAFLAEARGLGRESARRRPPMRLRLLIDSAIGALPALRSQPVQTEEGSAPAAVDSPVEGVRESRATAGARRQQTDGVPPATPFSYPEADPADSFEDDLLPFGHRFDLDDDLPGDMREAAASPLEIDWAADAEPHRPKAGQDAAVAHAGADVPLLAMGGQPAAGEGTAALRHEGDRDSGPSGYGRVDLDAVADLCAALARAAAAGDVVAVLRDAAAALGAAGLVLWMWDGRASALRPVVAHGYADAVVARLGPVGAEADNAIAAAYRSAAPRVVEGSGFETGALAVPLTTASGCAGVLALELRHGRERQPLVQASARIVAAQLSMFFGPPELAQAASA